MFSSIGTTGTPIIASTFIVASAQSDHLTILSATTLAVGILVLISFVLTRAARLLIR